jgi:hypothetical protein
MNASIPAALTGTLPNELGAYLCAPDLVYRWESGKGWAEARLLKLDNDKYLHRLAYGLNDLGMGSDGPIIAYKDGETLKASIAGIQKAVENLVVMCRARGRDKARCASLELWSLSLSDSAVWQDGEVEPPDEGEDEPARHDPLPSSLPVPAAMLEDAARAMAAQVGYQLPADSTDPDLICRDIVANMRRTAEACIEIGRGLLVLKAVCGKGNFMNRVDALGIEHSLATRFMQTALKFSKYATSHTLTKVVKSQSKLLELLVLDDEQIEELAETGQTRELTLDDVACMSVSELRKTLRQTRLDKDNLSLKLNLAAERAERLTRGASVSAAPGMSPETAQARTLCLSAQKTAEIKLDGLWTLFMRDASGIFSGDGDARLRMETVWITAHIIAARALDVIARMREESPVELPERVTGRHVLTPEEAERWRHDARLIENAEGLEVARLRAPLPEKRGRGRPRKDAKG